MTIVLSIWISGELYIQEHFRQYSDNILLFEPISDPQHPSNLAASAIITDNARYSLPAVPSRSAKATEAGVRAMLRVQVTPRLEM
jgi:hypothetical protein